MNNSSMKHSPLKPKCIGLQKKRFCKTNMSKSKGDRLATAHLPTLPYAYIAYAVCLTVNPKSLCRLCSRLKTADGDLAEFDLRSARECKKILGPRLLPFGSVIGCAFDVSIKV